MKATTGTINKINVKIIVVEAGERFTDFIQDADNYTWMRKGDDYEDEAELKEYFPNTHRLAASAGADLNTARGILEIR